MQLPLGNAGSRPRGLDSKRAVFDFSSGPGSALNIWASAGFLPFGPILQCSPLPPLGAGRPNLILGTLALLPLAVPICDRRLRW